MLVINFDFDSALWATEFLLESDFEVSLLESSEVTSASTQSEVLQLGISLLEA